VRGIPNPDILAHNNGLQMAAAFGGRRVYLPILEFLKEAHMRITPLLNRGKNGLIKRF
jgi:hypothetical protein